MKTSLRFDEHTFIHEESTRIPGGYVMKGHVCRHMRDVEEAELYADKVRDWFAANGAPTDVLVVQAMSTTEQHFEVTIDANGLPIVYVAPAPSPEDILGDRLRQNAPLKERIVLLDAALPLSEQEHTHAECLTDAIKGGALMRETGLIRCKAFLDRRVDCAFRDCGYAPSQLMWAILLCRPWPEDGRNELRELVRGYIRAGYLILDSPIDCWVDGSYIRTPTPLERAVRIGNSDLVALLIEEGADLMMVPAEPLIDVNGNAVVEQGQLLELIAFHRPTDDVMPVAAREAIMRRQLTKRSEEIRSAPSSEGMRRRRLV